MTAKGQNEVLFYGEFLNFVWRKGRVQVTQTLRSFAAKPPRAPKPLERRHSWAAENNRGAKNRRSSMEQRDKCADFQLFWRKH
jgi:hypothetical protein